MWLGAAGTFVVLAAAGSRARGPVARRVLLYVDPSGPAEGAESAAVLAAVHDCGAECITLWSTPTADALCHQSNDDTAAVRRVRASQAPGQGEEMEWAASHLAGACVEGVLCGSDGGLATAERLQHVLVPHRSNGIDPARRDKFAMNARCGAAGLPVAAQAAPSDWPECEDFLTRLARGNAVRAVLKPRRGQASVGVHLVHGWAEARAVFEGLSAFPVSTDATEVGTACVVQEVLRGREWVVDTVSRDGRHKTLALWRYDKGEANGAAFVYFGAEPMGAFGPDAQSVLGYALRVLDALGWRWGPAHLEIMCTSEGPRLVEINAGRWNGLDFKLLADLCYGANAYDATVAAFLDPAAFDALPDAPPAELACWGMLAVLCSYVEGRLARVRAEALDGLQSLVALETAVHEGDIIACTIDLDSAAGYAHLLHADAKVVQEEYQRLRREMPRLFELQPQTQPA